MLHFLTWVVFKECVLYNGWLFCIFYVFFCVCYIYNQQFNSFFFFVFYAYIFAYCSSAV